LSTEPSEAKAIAHGWLFLFIHLKSPLNKYTPSQIDSKIQAQSPQKTQNPDCSGFCAFVEGAGLFLFDPPTDGERQKCRAGVAQNSRQGIYV